MAAICIQRQATEGGWKWLPGEAKRGCVNWAQTQGYGVQTKLFNCNIQQLLRERVRETTHATQYLLQSFTMYHIHR